MEGLCQNGGGRGVSGREELRLVTADLAVQTGRSVDVQHDITAADSELMIIIRAVCAHRAVPGPDLT